MEKESDWLFSSVPLARRVDAFTPKLARGGAKASPSLLFRPAALQRRLGGLSKSFERVRSHDVKIITHGESYVVPFPRKVFP